MDSSSGGGVVLPLAQGTTGGAGAPAAPPANRPPAVDIPPALAIAVLLVAVIGFVLMVKAFRHFIATRNDPIGGFSAEQLQQLRSEGKISHSEYQRAMQLLAEQFSAGDTRGKGQ